MSIYNRINLHFRLSQTLFCVVFHNSNMTVSFNEKLNASFADKCNINQVFLIYPFSVPLVHISFGLKGLARNESYCT